MKEGISFIVPLRGRREQIPGLIHNIKRYYKIFEILFCCQDDNRLFRKGQLANLGSKKAKYDLLAFINLDYRFLSFVDIVREMKKRDQPICTMSDQARVVETSLGVLKIVRKPIPAMSTGGCSVFTKEQWMKSSGNSNLIIGWGPDDDLLHYRTNLFKLSGVSMGHIVHSKGGSYFDAEVKLRNRRIKMKAPARDHKKDGINQTIADESGKIVIEDNIVEYKFRNIRVPDDFAFPDRYQQGIDLEKKVLTLK